MHGEDQFKDYEKADGQETPPHAWGRPPSLQEGLLFVGNTPTCMGKTVAEEVNPSLNPGNTPTCMGKTMPRKSESAWW